MSILDYLKQSEWYILTKEVSWLFLLVFGAIAWLIKRWHKESAEKHQEIKKYITGVYNLKSCIDLVANKRRYRQECERALDAMNKESIKQKNTLAEILKTTKLSKKKEKVIDDFDFELRRLCVELENNWIRSYYKPMWGTNYEEDRKLEFALFCAKFEIHIKHGLDKISKWTKFFWQ